MMSALDYELEMNTYDNLPKKIRLFLANNHLGLDAEFAKNAYEMNDGDEDAAIEALQAFNRLFS